MPTYQYECEHCQHSFEVLQSMVEPRLKKCPKCGKSKLVRLIGSGSGMIFKGSGFYATDYRKKAPAGSKTDKPALTPSKDASASPSPAKGGACGGACACHPN
ncbi:MAG TPA: zinc ribbon domain-containing protein [Candidatus Omnitrophota bacterium]|nr:zinc ribbon domain-containing protein [Candidatus Omnitrophota bacterium]